MSLWYGVGRFCCGTGRGESRTFYKDRRNVFTLWPRPSSILSFFSSPFWVTDTYTLRRLPTRLLSCIKVLTLVLYKVFERTGTSPNRRLPVLAPMVRDKCSKDRRDVHLHWKTQEVLPTNRSMDPTHLGLLRVSENLFWAPRFRSPRDRHLYKSGSRVFTHRSSHSGGVCCPDLWSFYGHSTFCLFPTPRQGLISSNFPVLLVYVAY